VSTPGRMRWGRTTIWRGGRVGAVMVAVHVVGLAVLAATTTPVEGVPELVLGGGGALALVLAVAWCCTCLRANPEHTVWLTDRETPEEPPLAPGHARPSWRAAWRSGWRPALVWLVTGAAVLVALDGTAGVAAFLVLTLLVVPAALLGGFIVWGLLVFPLVYVVHGVGRLGSAPSRDGRRLGAGVPMAFMGLMVLCATPIAVCLVLGVESAGRWNVWGPLTGLDLDPDDVVSHELLWIARVFAIILVGLVATFVWLVSRGRGPEQR
jgi:hypothetical protein